MTIKKRLYISFSLILFIIIFIIGVFFYATYNLNEIHLTQNHRYDQIRKVEKLKEYNNAFAWIVLDIVTDWDKTKVIKDRISKANIIFKQLKAKRSDIVNNSESENEKRNIIQIFNHFEKIENLINAEFIKFTNKKFTYEYLLEVNKRFEKINKKTDKFLVDEIAFLQNKLNQTEKIKDDFIDKIKLELVVLLFIAFSLSFIISTKLINEIKKLLDKLNNGVLQLLKNDENTIKIDIGKNNELSEITNNLNTYLEQQDDMIHSREELLRNISHELKTPITKGKFLLEKVKEGCSNSSVESINSVFYDIEELTSKLLQREKLNFATIKSSKFKATTLILDSLSKLSVDDESKVDIAIEDDFDIEGDRYYLTIALKNLIDNAMKYATNYPISIIAKNDKLYIANESKQLSNDFIYYIQPFTREPNQQLGHGLGLNIVNKITTMHGFKLNHQYKDFKNIFYISFTNNS